MSRKARRAISAGRLLILASLIGAVAFGLFIGYLAYSNDSFPRQQKPFANYATVMSDTFNSTEFAFNIRWDNASALPLYAQLNSPATDAANTPVCSTGVSNVTAGQPIFMGFTITPASPTLENVDLSIAVRSLATGAQFTIVYNIPTISASNAPITPSNIACQEPPGIE